LVCNLIAGHFAGNFHAPRPGRNIAPRRGDVEPFMGRNEIGDHVAPRRVEHPQLEQRIRRAHLRAETNVRRNRQPCHDYCPPVEVSER
jgi:hypothetical protein